MVLSWTQILDDFEKRIAEVEYALDAGGILDVSLAHFEPPVGMVPLPDELEERATHVLALLHETELRMENQRGEVARALAQATRSRSRPSPFANLAAAHLFDQSL